MTNVLAPPRTTGTDPRNTSTNGVRTEEEPSGKDLRKASRGPGDTTPLSSMQEQEKRKGRPVHPPSTSARSVLQLTSLT